MSSSSRDSRSSLSPGVERRRLLRQQNRRERTINLWRVIVFASVTGSLGWLLLSQGWTLTSSEQIKIKGSPNLQLAAVIQAGGLSFPQPLLGLNPKELEETLLQQLPVKSVVVHRRLLPPALELDLRERKPIAYALRRSRNGKERGMVDGFGQWMELSVAKQGERPATSITVDGWMASQRMNISQVLEQRDQLGSPLERIVIAASGDLSLRTKGLGLIYLGANAGNLEQQLEAIAHLSRTLPPSFRHKTGTTIDLSDPAKPELQMPQKAKPDA